MELIFSIAEEGVGLHSICNCLRKAKVLKLSFYKKELFERFMDEEKMYAVMANRAFKKDAFNDMVPKIKKYL